MGRQGTAASRDSYQQFRAAWSWSATAIFCGLALAATGAFLLAAPLFPDVAPAHVRADWLALAALIAGLFTANMARMFQIWARLRPLIVKPAPRRSDSERKIVKQGLRELFAYTFIVLTALTAFTFLSAQPGLLPWQPLGLHGAGLADAHPQHVATLIMVLALALIPPLSAIYLQAKAEEKAFSRKLLRNDVISAGSFWVGAAILLSIVALASWATKVSGNESATLASNLTFFVTLGVIALFVAFIFLPHIVRYLDQAADREAGAPPIAAQGFNPILLPAQAASYLDSLLVRLIAPLTGATQKGPGVPHSFVLLSIIPLTALGFVLAPPFGLIPIALGMLMVIALGRRWAWIEEDRETASRLLKTESPEIQVGFDNDLKDEALLGYASLFLLVPLALHQIYGWQTTAFEITDASRATNLFFAWLSFFGAELAKAVPFVDWWEIYQVDLSPPIEAASDNPLGKHLTFAARAMVDLVIMAALFQAIAIWQRARAQKKLYQIGHVNHFEPFAERDFFESAFSPGSNNPKPEFEKKIREHVAAREALRQSPEPYSPDRLADLIRSENKTVGAAARWMVREFKVLVGTPTEKLAQLHHQWSTLVAARSFVQLAADNSTTARREFLNEKHKLEGLLEELLILNRGALTQAHVGLLLGLMSNIRGCQEFSFAQIQMLRLFGKLGGEYALLALAAHVARRDVNSAEMTKLLARIESKFPLQNIARFGQAPMRIKVYEALEAFGAEKPWPTTCGIHKRCLAVLELLSDSNIEGSREGAARAAAAAEKVRAAIKERGCDGAPELNDHSDPDQDLNEDA